MSDDDELLTADEAAALMRFAPNSMYSLRARGRGPRSFNLGRRVVYRRSEVLAWIAEQEATTTRGGTP